MNDGKFPEERDHVICGHHLELVKPRLQLHLVRNIVLFIMLSNFLIINQEQLFD